MSVGDINQHIVTATQTLRPAAGETWRLESLRLTAPAGQTITVEITDGTNTHTWFEGTSDTDISFGRIGTRKGVVSAQPLVEKTNLTFNNSCAPSIHLHNDFYLNVTVTGTAVGYFEFLETAVGNKGLAISKSRILTGGATTVQPAAGETWELKGFSIQSPESVPVGGTSSYFVAKTNSLNLTNGTTNMLISSATSGAGHSGSEIYKEWSIYTFGTLGMSDTETTLITDTKVRPIVNVVYGHTHYISIPTGSAAATTTNQIVTPTGYQLFNIYLSNSVYLGWTTDATSAGYGYAILDMIQVL